MLGLVESFCGFLTVLSVFPVATQARTCYLTSGLEADSSFRPCYPDQDESHCCSLAKDNDVPNDICLTGGVCYVQDPYFRGLLRQGACTDSTWGSSGCPSYNTTALNETFYMIPCKTQGRGYWCASDGGDCCENAARYDMGSLMNVTVTAFSGAVTSASGSSSTTSSVTSTPSSTNTADSSNDSTVADSTSSCHSKKDTAATIGVGVALGACLLAALIVIFMQRRIYKKNMRNQAPIHGDLAITQLHRKSAYPVELEPVAKSVQPVELR